MYKIEIYSKETTKLSVKMKTCTPSKVMWFHWVTLPIMTPGPPLSAQYPKISESSIFQFNSIDPNLKGGTARFHFSIRSKQSIPYVGSLVLWAGHKGSASKWWWWWGFGPLATSFFQIILFFCTSHSTFDRYIVLIMSCLDKLGWPCSIV